MQRPNASGSLPEHFALLRKWDRWMGSQGLSATTRKRYRGWVIRFIDDSVVPLRDATEAHVEAFLRAPRVMHRLTTVAVPRPAERAEAMEAFRTFFRWSSAAAER